MSKYLISAIVSTYNSERFFRGKIEDLLAQSIKDRMEIIVIISGSEQNESNIIEEYLATNENIRVIVTEAKETIYEAWNRGIKVSDAKYITNANTDDRLRNDALEIMTDYLEKHPELYLVYADQYISDIPNENFSTIRKRQKYLKPDYSGLLLLERCIIGSQPVWRASVHTEDGMYFNEEYEIAGDYEFELRLAKKHKIAHLSEILGIYYKSVNKENKEYENSQKTLEETYNIMKYNIHEFIQISDPKYISKLISHFNFKLKIPIRIYSFIRHNINRMFPRIELNSQQFFVLFLSCYFVSIGDSVNAIFICERFLEKSQSKFIKLRLTDLKKDEQT